MSGGTGYTWWADSLDGTRPFTEKKPESTIGVCVYDEADKYLAGAIVHPGRMQMAYAVRGFGSYLVGLDDDFEVSGKSERIAVSTKSMSGGTVSIDSLFTPFNSQKKLLLMSALHSLATNEGKFTVSYDMLGSNIAYQFDVARGVSVLGVTDAVGGPWDWRVGNALVTEAGGVMLDGVTGGRPTNESQLLIYGSQLVVDQVLPLTQKIYAGYTGFAPKQK